MKRDTVPKESRSTSAEVARVGGLVGGKIARPDIFPASCRTNRNKSVAKKFV